MDKNVHTEGFVPGEGRDLVERACGRQDKGEQSGADGSSLNWLRRERVLGQRVHRIGDGDSPAIPRLLWAAVLCGLPEKTGCDKGKNLQEAYPAAGGHVLYLWPVLPERRMEGNVIVQNRQRKIVKFLPNICN